MFDLIPEHARLFVVLVIAAFVPAKYLYRYVTQSPRGHDITQPPEDFSWRTQSRLYRNLGTLAVMGAAAWLISTSAAENLFRSMSSHDEAPVEYVRVLDVDPSNPMRPSNDVRSDIEAGDQQAAIDRLTQKLAENPDDLRALRARADLYWAMGERKKSRDDEDRIYKLEAEAKPWLHYRR
jgi:tetratricopeptide (TPR) repeat protein